MKLLMFERNILRAGGQFLEASQGAEVLRPIISEATGIIDKTLGKCERVMLIRLVPNWLETLTKADVARFPNGVLPIVMGPESFPEIYPEVRQMVLDLGFAYELRNDDTSSPRRQGLWLLVFRS